MDKQFTSDPRLSEKAYDQSYECVSTFCRTCSTNKHSVARAVDAQFEVKVTNC